MIKIQTPHRLVLLGGGHSHVEVVRQFNPKNWPNTRLTLVSENAITPYSGLLPGHIAGECSAHNMHIHLPSLCQQHDVHWVLARATGIQRSVQQLQLEAHPPLQYDTLSINIGATPSTSLVNIKSTNPFNQTAACPAWVPVKPIHSLLKAWQHLQTTLQHRTQPLPLAVVGGGAAGVELILAMQQAMVSQHANHHLVQWHLFCTKSLLPQHPLGMQQHLRNTLAQHRIIVHEHCPIATFNVDNKVLIDAHQSQWPVHTVFWAGPAQAPAWLYASGLAASPHSGILVHPTLQSKLDPRIFASGDACEFPITNQGKLQAEYLPKAGVFAVRMGRILANNLRYHSHIKRWKTYVPQRTWLAIVRTGQGQAVASKGRWWVHGAWVWHLKHHLDTTFIKRYSTPRL